MTEREMKIQVALGTLTWSAIHNHVTSKYRSALAGSFLIERYLLDYAYSRGWFPNYALKYCELYESNNNFVMYNDNNFSPLPHRKSSFYKPPGYKDD